ncbi:hypothetical protein RHMOL_Rhmol09G0148700 [Rhododendron molle]|uniref:Uncharacterized protein n=1 Tax=Rhododendron molle TaxID=49168 RepID=A0ACC0MDB4_RHOML|nr:hypothetical protein RHMOL_Rhmol09G0148700 [Rhododendron molle]
MHESCMIPPPPLQPRDLLQEQLLRYRRGGAAPPRHTSGQARLPRPAANRRQGVLLPPPHAQHPQQPDLLALFATAVVKEGQEEGREGYGFGWWCGALRRRKKECVRESKICEGEGESEAGSSSAKALQPGDTYCDSAILLETEQSEDSSISKLLRWLTASVILGRLSLRSVDLELNFAPEKSNLGTLQSLLKLNKNGCGENKCGFGYEEMLAASIFGLQQLLGMECRLLSSVVSALSLLLLSDLLHLAAHIIPRHVQEVLMRDWNGNLIADFSSQLGGISALTAEVWAMH